MVRVLAVSDEVDEGLWHDPGSAGAVDLILACGDLPFDFLGHLMECLDAPLAFVPGNHDPELGGFRLGRGGLVLRAGLPEDPPWPPGAANVDGRVVDVAGLRVAGLGGCLRYGGGPNQYSQRHQAGRVRRLAASARWRAVCDGKAVDVVLTHAPPSGVGDGDDAPHRGFTALHRLVASIDPPLLLHGHVHPYGAAAPDLRMGRTIVRNVVGRRVFDIAPHDAPVGHHGS